MKKNVPLRALIIILWTSIIMGSLYFPYIEFIREERTLNIFTWGDILHPEVIRQFEKEKKVKVRLSYYNSNEELIVKMKATKGVGYDLIIPSDYAVKILENENLLKEISHEKLNFWSSLDPKVLNHPFDPKNQYSIPFEWEVFGIGYDKDHFTKTSAPSKYSELFNHTLDYRIVMPSDPNEAIQIAAFSLFGPEVKLDLAQRSAITKALINQKKEVEAYANFRGDYFLATKNAAVVLASSSYIWRSQQKFSFIGFTVPSDYQFITIESFCLPQETPREDLCYEFINYVFSEDSLRKHFDAYGFFPARKMSPMDLSPDPKKRALYESLMDLENSFYFFYPMLEPQELHKIWIELKSIN